MVGERGFEPPTPWSRTRCSTRLSHSPTRRLAPTFLHFIAPAVKLQTCHSRPSSYMSEPRDRSFAPAAAFALAAFHRVAWAAIAHYLQSPGTFRRRLSGQVPHSPASRARCRCDCAQPAMKEGPVAKDPWISQAAFSLFLLSDSPGASSTVTCDSASAARANSSAWCQALLLNERRAASCALL
jgi:hypothetical protein